MQTPIFLNTLESQGMTLSVLQAKLQENFPPFTPHPGDPDRMIMYKSGQRSVIEWITNYLSEEDNG